MSSSLDPRDYSGIYFKAKSSVSAPATAPYKALQATLRSEMVGITKSREKMIPILKALHEQWKLDQTPFPLFDSLLVDTFGKSRSWVWEFVRELAPELGFNAGGRDPEGNCPEKDAKALDNVETKATSDAAAPPAAQTADKTPDTSPPETPTKPAPQATAAVDTKKDIPTMDDTGFPIPSVAMPFWERKHEVQSLLTEVSRLRTKFKEYQDADDSLLGWICNQVQADLDMVYAHVKDSKPYAVCPYCLGEQCRMCRGTGVVSEMLLEKYLPVLPPATKKSREDIISKWKTH